jgi:hypothetical protein
MQRHTVYFYLETTLHVSGGTFTHTYFFSTATIVTQKRLNPHPANVENTMRS